MTFATDYASDRDNVILNTDEFGISITHRPLGVSANDATITAVFEEDDAEIDTSRGREIKRMATLHVSSSLSIDEKDLFVISSQVWSVQSFRKAEFGMIEIRIRRNEDESRHSPGGMLK